MENIKSLIKLEDMSDHVRVKDDSSNDDEHQDLISNCYDEAIIKKEFNEEVKKDKSCMENVDTITTDETVDKQPSPLTEKADSIKCGKAHTCQVCWKVFITPSKLKTHQVTHTGERNHQCQICGKTFTQSGNLKTHLVTHTGERNHQCKICGKNFTRSSHLKDHQHVHTGERNHSCHICGKTFKTSSNLSSHLIS